MAHEDPPSSTHGPHTLRVVQGEIVGVSGDDVFVELGPRMQGVLSVRKFAEPPCVGEEFEFKLHGQEESLWVLSLAEAASLPSWRDMEVGSLVHARAIRSRVGGLELKVGRLHAFMPDSQTGLPRGQKTSLLVGKNFLCEVLEVDPERQRVVLSRRLVLRRERDSEQHKELGNLKPGQVVQGRVIRIEKYGVFLRFGRGLEGLIHVSNLSHERVENPREVFKKGQSLSARVLNIRQQGKRISLGLKQLGGDPWQQVERRFYIDQIVDARVTKVLEFGLFVTIVPGIEGLLPRSEARLGAHQGPREQYHEGDRLAVRILDLDLEAQRLTVSRNHRNGSEIQPEEALDYSELGDLSKGRGPQEGLRSSLNDALREALGFERTSPSPEEDEAHE